MLDRTGSDSGDGEVMAGCQVVVSFFCNEMKLVDEQQVSSVHSISNISECPEDL